MKRTRYYVIGRQDVSPDAIRNDRDYCTYSIQTEPGYTNMSGEEREDGWLGQTGDVSRTACGAYKTLEDAIRYIVTEGAPWLAVTNPYGPVCEECQNIADSVSYAAQRVQQDLSSGDDEAAIYFSERNEAAPVWDADDYIYEAIPLDEEDLDRLIPEWEAAAAEGARKGEFYVRGSIANAARELYAEQHGDD